MLYDCLGTNTTLTELNLRGERSQLFNHPLTKLDFLLMTYTDSHRAYHPLKFDGALATLDLSSEQKSESVRSFSFSLDLLLEELQTDDSVTALNLSGGHLFMQIEV